MLEAANNAQKSVFVEALPAFIVLNDLQLDVVYKIDLSANDLILVIIYYITIGGYNITSKIIVSP